MEGEAATSQTRYETSHAEIKIEGQRGRIRYVRLSRSSKVLYSKRLAGFCSAYGRKRQ